MKVTLANLKEIKFLERDQVAQLIRKLVIKQKDRYLNRFSQPQYSQNDALDELTRWVY